MTYLLRVSKKPTFDAHEQSQFPFCVRSIQAFDNVDLSAQVTFFVGENGSGKSTLLEALAYLTEIVNIGYTSVALDPTLVAQRDFGNCLRLAWSKRTRQGFFLRAEDFLGYLRGQARDQARERREVHEVQPLVDARTLLGFDDSKHIDEIAGEPRLRALDRRSHGESFLDLFETRVNAAGLYLLDEPEAPLSPARQKDLLALITKRASAGAQFIIATHSPILLAISNARIFEFSNGGVQPTTYDHAPSVRTMREFLCSASCT
jgi:predicted ATPase